MTKDTDIKLLKQMGVLSDFEMAKRILEDEPGDMVVARDAYVCFRYIADDVRIVFYPHKSSTGNYHIRVRNENSKNKSKFYELQVKLSVGSGLNCTFHLKNHHNFVEEHKYVKANGIEFGWAEQ